MNFLNNTLPIYMQLIQEGRKRFQKFTAPVKILKFETVKRYLETVILKKVLLKDGIFDWWLFHFWPSPIHHLKTQSISITIACDNSCAIFPPSRWCNTFVRGV